MTTYTLPTLPTGEITRMYAREGAVFAEVNGEWHFLSPTGTLSKASNPTK